MSVVSQPNKSEMTVVQELIERPGAVNVPEIISALGIEYREELMEPGSSGRIDHVGDGYRIIVNSNQSAQRKNFTAAHELAHYLLHRDLLHEQGHLDRLFDLKSGWQQGSTLSPRHEVEANKLAAQILMPRRKIIDEMVWRKYNILEMARELGVSQAALEIRLKVLGIDLDIERKREAGIVDDDFPF